MLFPISKAAPLALYVYGGLQVSIGDAAAARSVFAEVEKILSDATAHNKVPAAVALAGDASGQRWAGAFGNFTNDGLCSHPQWRTGLWGLWQDTPHHTNTSNNGLNGHTGLNGPTLAGIDCIGPYGIDSG